MTMIHEGIKPKNKLLKGEEIDDLPFRYKTNDHWVEPLDDGGYKIWSKRELLSGCKQEITNVRKRDGLIYCPICDEWFAEKQFVEKEIV